MHIADLYIRDSCHRSKTDLVYSHVNDAVAKK